MAQQEKKVLRDVELHWCSVDPTNPTESFEKLVWTVTAHVDKDTAKALKKDKLIRNLKEVEDENGDETGMYKININKLAVSRDGKELIPPGSFILNEAGKMEPLDTSAVGIGNGSKGHVSYSTYDWSYNGKTGKSMSLANVVVTSLVPYVRSDGVDEFGFEKEAGSEFSHNEIKEKVSEEDVF